MKKKRSILRRCMIAWAVVVLTGVAAFLLHFPGQQAPMAITLATGLGTPSLQARVDALEEKAIHGKSLTNSEKQFLTDLYTCFAKGGRLTYVLRQSAQMMQHYLDASGNDLQIQSRIFIGSSPVQEQMIRLRKRITFDFEQQNSLLAEYTSPTFYMGDPHFFEAQAGLYYGKITARPSLNDDRQLKIDWNVEMPWQWPTYESLNQRWGTYHAQCFPIPNARSFIQGSQHCLWIDDGLGEHLAQLGLAKPFLVLSTWQD